MTEASNKPNTFQDGKQELTETINRLSEQSIINFASLAMSAEERRGGSSKSRTCLTGRKLIVSGFVWKGRRLRLRRRPTSPSAPRDRPSQRSPPRWTPPSSPTLLSPATARPRSECGKPWGVATRTPCTSLLSAPSDL